MKDEEGGEEGEELLSHKTSRIRKKVSQYSCTSTPSTRSGGLLGRLPGLGATLAVVTNHKVVRADDVQIELRTSHHHGDGVIITRPGQISSISE